MLAAETVVGLARRGLAVAAVDADLDRGSLHYRLDVPVSRATFSIADVLKVIDEITEERLREALAACACGARLLPPPAPGFDLTGLDAARARELIEALAGAFDCSVVDTRPSQDPFTAGLLAAADVVVLVVTPELACLGGARRALEALDSLPGGRPRVELVLNRSLASHDLVTRRDIETFLGVEASVVLPEDTVRCRRLADECKPICSERSPLAEALLGFIHGLAVTCRSPS